MTLDEHAAKLGYQKIRENVWIHPETSKTVQVSGGTITVTEDTSFETMANVVHVLTCNAGRLDKACLGKVDGDWAFVVDESLQDRFMLLVMHAPTSMVSTPIKTVKVAYEDYNNGDFVGLMASKAASERGLRLNECEVFVMPTKIAQLSVVCVLSIEDIACPFHGVLIDQVIKMEPPSPDSSEFIQVLQAVLDGDRPQSAYTSEREEHRLVHQPDGYTASYDLPPDILFALQESP